MNPTDRILPGVALMIAFCVIAPLIDVASKLAAQGVPVGVIVLGRGIVQAALMLPVVLLMRLPLGLTRRTLGLATLRALMLVVSTLGLLFFPKVLAIFDVLLSRRRKEHGGFFRLMFSVHLEMLISTLLAPIRMLAHSRYVIEALLNVSLRWAGQNRGDETSWGVAISNQAPGSLLAVAWAGFAWWLDPMFFYWSLPVAIPLILAAPTSVLFSRASLGDTLRRWGLLLVPEERNGNRLLDDLDNGAPLGPRQSDDDTSAFVEAIIDPIINRMHADAARGRAAGAKREHLRQLCGRCMLNGPSALTPKQLSLLAHDRESLQWLHQAAWRAPTDSFWGRELHARSCAD